MSDDAKTLQSQIDKHQKEIATDMYAVSIGELANMYTEGDLNTFPEYQRYFRWEIEQKARFIESILLGIPVPSIFAVQRDTGVLDVVDGLQRLSTLFEFMGILRNEKGELLKPSALTRTRFLPALQGMKWDNAKDPAHELSDAQKRFIKRSKLDLKIVLRQSSPDAKYELFQRINTGGNFLSDQEIRNAKLAAVSPDFLRWIRSLKDYRNFSESVALSDNQLLEQYDVELIVRFICLWDIDASELRDMGDVAEFLDDKSLTFAKNWTTRKQAALEEVFTGTFDVVAKVGEDLFRRHDARKMRFSGGFLISAYEAIACGIGHSLKHAKKFSPDSLREKAGSLWANEEFLKYSGSGSRASARLPRTIAIGRRLFGK